jgi:Cys-tRNA(Pro)/Cys-tRNA(Cys) deacylase
MRILEGLGIEYSLKEYDVNLDDLSAPNVAKKIGLPPEQVFKTLVVRGDRTGVFLAVIPAATELDLKAIAQLSGDRKVDTVSLKEVQPLTGYIRGGVTAFGCKKNYIVYVDETLILFEQIAVSAGARGIQLLMRPDDYLRATGAVTGDISRSQE